MKAAIFAAVSPLQYINILEAIHAFDLKPQQCFLALGVSRKLPASAQQTRELLDESLFRTVTTVSGVPAERGRSPIHTEIFALAGAREYANSANRLMEQARRECDGIGWVFIGDYRPRNFRHFLASAPEAEHWLMDDGSVTHQVVRYRKDPSSPHVFSGQFEKWNRKLPVYAALAGLKFTVPRQLGFFTCYDIDPPPQDRVLVHHYERFHLTYPALKCVDEVWFLGANHPENGFTSLARYTSLLRRAKQYYGNRRVVYLPHRGEAPFKLQMIEKLGFEIRTHELPIEIVVGRTGVYPRVLAGIASSAIDNLSVILGERLQVDVFRVADDYSSGAKWNHLKDVIDYHQRDILGITRFVDELANTSLDSPALDPRIDPSTVSASGGYAYGLEQRLRGFHRSRSLLTAATGVFELQLENPGRHRAFKKGDPVTLVPTQAGEGSMSGLVEDYRNDGYLRVTLSRCDCEGEFEDWLVQRRIPRLEYHPELRTMLGCLLEPGSQNHLLFSQDMSREAWERAGLLDFGRGSAATSPILRGPDGLFSAAFLQLDGSEQRHGIMQAVPALDAGPKTFSLYARGGGCDRLFLQLQHRMSGRSCTAAFGLGNDDRSRSADLADRSEIYDRIILGRRDEAGGWQRFYMTVEMPAGECLVGLFLGGVRCDPIVHRGDGCSGLYVWGIQLESTETPTSFLPTQGRTLSRAPEGLELKLPSSKWALLVELAVPYAEYEVQLLELGAIRLSLCCREGRLWVKSENDSAEGFCVPKCALSPFVVGILKTESGLSIAIDGELAVRDFRAQETAAAHVRGGPMHLRRAQVISENLSMNAFLGLSTLQGFSAIPARLNERARKSIAQK